MWFQFWKAQCRDWLRLWWGTRPLTIWSLWRIQSITITRISLLQEYKFSYCVLLSVRPQLQNSIHEVRNNAASVQINYKSARGAIPASFPCAKLIGERDIQHVTSSAYAMRPFKDPRVSLQDESQTNITRALIRMRCSLTRMERDSARGAIQSGLKILARFFQTGLGFSVQPNGLRNPCNRYHFIHPGPKKEREHAHRLCFRTSVNFLMEICVLRPG